MVLWSREVGRLLTRWNGVKRGRGRTFQAGDKHTKRSVLQYLSKSRLPGHVTGRTTENAEHRQALGRLVSC